MQQRKDLTAWRDPIKGIAILWVCFFHARLGLNHIPVIGSIQQVGYLGADVLLFLSGYGLYHSLQRSQSLKEYYTRRLKRLLPSYLPIAILWCIIMIPMLDLSTVQAIRSIVGTLSMMGFIAETPRYLNWYLSLILITLILAPILHSFLSKTKRPLLTWALLVLAACAVGLCYVAHNQLIMYSRLPVFVLGMGFAMPRNGKERPKLSLLLYVVGFAAGCAILWLCMNRYIELLMDYGMYWYPGALMIPPLCVALGFLFRLCSKATFLIAPLRLLGQASFEIFLFNTWFEFYCKEIAQYTEPRDYLLWMLFSIAAGLAAHIGISAIMRLFSQKSTNA